MDVDGVLTDGSIVLLKSGEEVKVWNVKDRIAFSMLEKSGRRFYVAWITGRASAQVKARAEELGVDALYQSCLDKRAALQDILRRFRLTARQALYIGDDLIDIAALKGAGLAVCPSDAVAEVKSVCSLVTRAPGGRGVFREAVDFVLRSQGLLRKVVAEFERPQSRLFKDAQGKKRR